MKPEKILECAVACHKEWLTLTENPRRPFKLYLAEKATQAFVQLRVQATLCEQLPKEVQRALKIPSGRQLGPSTLQKYAGEITRYWLKQKPGLTLAEFTTEIASECQTEGELRKYLNL